MKIHPNWSNRPSDMKNFDKGNVALKGKDETTKFKSGDINQWDISLISKVLLHSQKCSDKLRNDSTFFGCKAAVEKITSIRNSVQGHSSSGELTKYDYDNEIDKLRIAVVDGLGYDAEDFKQAIEGLSF